MSDTQFITACTYKLKCNKRNDEGHNNQFSHPGDIETLLRKNAELEQEKVNLIKTINEFSHSNDIKNLLRQNAALEQEKVDLIDAISERDETIDQLQEIIIQFRSAIGQISKIASSFMPRTELPQTNLNLIPVTDQYVVPHIHIRSQYQKKPKKPYSPNQKNKFKVDPAQKESSTAQKESSPVQTESSLPQKGWGAPNTPDTWIDRSNQIG